MGTITECELNSSKTEENKFDFTMRYKGLEGLKIYFNDARSKAISNYQDLKEDMSIYLPNSYEFFDLDDPVFTIRKIDNDFLAFRENGGVSLRFDTKISSWICTGYFTSFGVNFSVKKIEDDEKIEISNEEFLSDIKKSKL